MNEHAPGKVNLCLFLGPVRTDGRHELVTVLESVSLSDELTLTVAAEDEVCCEGVDGPNLVTEALRLLRERGWEGPPVRIEISKRIPVAAGMAGGSADAAAALRLAARVVPLPASVALEIATTLGSDVPSQLAPGLVLGTGAGDVVQALPPLPEHAFVIAPQPFGLSTAAVYREADRLGLGRDAAELTELSTSWRCHLGVNDLEAAALSLAPALVGTLEALRVAGADRAFVCGSGPTCAGLFCGADGAARAARAADVLPSARAVVPVSSIRHNSPFV